MTVLPLIQRILRPALPAILTLCALCTAILPTIAYASGNSFFNNNSNDGFLPVDEALPFNYITDTDAVVLSWNIAPGHYLYKSRIKIMAVDKSVTVGQFEFSLPGTLTEDEFFGEMTVFFEPVNVRVPITLPENASEAELQVSYQGCAEAGLCYPPQTKDILYYPGKGAAEPTASRNTSNANPLNTGDTSSATGLAGLLSSQSIWMIAGVFFLLGLGLTFTPCVLPMVPIISSMVSGQNTRTTGQALLLSGSYVLGMAITYAAAGVITGLLGASFNLQAQLQSPWVLGVFATLFVIFALSMFDMFEIQLPRAIREPLNDASQRMTGGRVLGIFGIGALSALIVSPCVSAPLAGSLLYISTTQDAVIGGMALLALGLGMGVPLILVAVGGRKLLPTTGRWMTTVKHFYGVMLLAVAIWLIERLIPAWAGLSLWGALVTITGVQLGALDTAKAGWERTRKGLGLILFAYGLALLAGAVSGATDPLRPLAPFTAAAEGYQKNTQNHAAFKRLENPEQIRTLLASAGETGQPVMLDFYADWCISCKVMERNVFNQPEVIQALAPYTLLQIDMTDNTPEQQAFLDELGLFGPPSILFYGSSGQELAEARILGEMDKQEFLAHLNKLP
ncbi:protein-disulfide reductase DsbD [Marinobacter sp.]|uniref:protein-disulfide reductase DsbD n=1 Tax=Marinobacter sp. TaxID=50741 RepID=UPI00356360B1